MERYRFDDVTMAALESLRVPLAVYQFLDKRVVTIMLSDGFCDMFQFDDKRDAYYAMDNDMYEETHPDDVARIANEAFRFATQGGKYEVVYRNHLRNSTEYKIVHAIGEHVYTPEGVRLAYVWYTDEGSYTTDEANHGSLLNTELRNALHEESLINASYYDYLTGLPSMSYFFELADAWRRNQLAEGKPMALLYLDLCGMKYFNRKYGFAEGDLLLQRFANLLKKHFSNENCSRFGSDHFCVFTSEDGLEDVLYRIFAEVREFPNGKSLAVRVGVFIDKDSATDISAGCDKAKYACDTMRNIYLSRFCYFNERMSQRAKITRYIIHNLDNALAEKHIEVYYQPVVRAANGRVCDEEALARWNDPDMGMLRPSEFIPILEEANLIYKLDLYVVERVLEKIKRQKEEGLLVVPHSVNLSRADFDACDIVEELCRLVDAAGVERSMINIEITESAVGNDFEFIKSQIDRFRSLGFHVWMDDFGSGYSSLDVLQSIRFDLIKFDMRFMKSFDEGDKSRIILTELIKMAIALGVDTVCEGVETKKQVEFLREVGCTMLQGYYFCRPVPLEEIFERYRRGIQIGFENPDETEYFASVGRINLYDLTNVANEERAAFEHYFNTLPMAVLEVSGDQMRMLRCNNSYRVFLSNTFNINETRGWMNCCESGNQFTDDFLHALRECCENGSKLLVDDSLKNGLVANTLLRRIAVNPVSGAIAVAVAVLSVIDHKNVPLTFTQIAKALSSDYISLYYVNLLTDNFIEYQSVSEAGEPEVERHGRNFFAYCADNAADDLCDIDGDSLRDAFTKDKVLRAIDENGVFTLSFRQLVEGVPTYVSLKAVRARNDADHLIVGLSNIDTQIQQAKTLERMKQEQITYLRISALSGSFICIYTVDPETNRYTEYSATPDYSVLNIPKQGEDFFAETIPVVTRVLCPDDIPMFRSAWSKEKILDEIRERGIFAMTYRLMLDGVPTHVSLKAALVQESDGAKLIFGLKKTDAPVKRGPITP